MELTLWVYLKVLKADFVLLNKTTTNNTLVGDPFPSKKNPHMRDCICLDSISMF